MTGDSIIATVDTAVRTCLPLQKCVAHYEVQNMTTEAPDCKQLNLYIKQEWERISLTKLQQSVSSVPKRLLTEILACLSFFGTCCGHQIQNTINNIHHFEHSISCRCTIFNCEYIDQRGLANYCTLISFSFDIVSQLFLELGC